MERIVLAHSGGLETTVAISWLREHGDAEVITLTVDLGQGRELEAIRDRALAAGAVRAHVLEAREAFGKDFIVPALRAGATEQWSAPQAVLLARPLIAQKLVEVAAIEQATAVAHGCVGDREAPFERALRSVEGVPAILTPVRRWTMTRDEQFEYLRQRGLSRPATDDVPWVETNLWGRSVVGVAGAGSASASFFTLTRPAAECPDEPASVEVSFDAGVPTGINGVNMPLLDVIASLGTIAGAHGVGRVGAAESGEDFEQPWIGEMPAAVVLTAAHQALQRHGLPEAVGRVALAAGREYARLVSAGGWFTPARRALDAVVDVAEEWVTGSVRLMLLQGTCRVIDIRTPAEAQVPHHWRSESGPATQGVPDRIAGGSLGLPS